MIFRNKGIKESDATGYGTGYPLTIKKNNEPYAQDLLSNEDKRKMLGISGRMFAEKMSWEKAANMERKAIRELLDSGNF